MAKFASSPNKAEFYVRVWALVRQIPPGRVTSYGLIADLLAPPEGVAPRTYRAFGARWVGGAMAACPADVPWQRVINAQGKISVRKGGSHLRQCALLKAEGVAFDDRGRIDLRHFGWYGADD